MRLLWIVTIVCTTLLPIAAYGDGQSVKLIPSLPADEDSQSVRLSPYRSGKYMYVITALLKIPPRQSYDQLSATDKSRFRTIFSDLDANVEPPYPRRGLRRILDPIYYAQNTQQETGLLDIIVRVDRAGQVQKVLFYASPSKAMTKQVAYILFKTKFKPALCASKPCDAEFPLLAKFNNEETLNNRANSLAQ